MSDVDENAVDTSELPGVFQMELSQREEFLSQVGSFTQEQRRIFHRICDFFDPMLDYNRFVLHAGKDILFANNQIEILMRKIRNAHYGLLKFKNDQGELKPDKIIITNRDSSFFYKNLVEDEIQRLMLDDNRVYLTLEEMEKSNLRLPFDLVETIYPETISPRFIDEIKSEEKIYTMPLKTGGAVLVTSQSLDALLEIARKKINSALNNSSFISAMSRVMGLKISEIQKKQYTNDPGFWKSISSDILKNSEDLKLRIKHLSSAVFQSSEMLHLYYINREAEAEKEREENREKQAAIEDICMEILKKEDFLFSPEDLLDLLDPYEEKWKGFKDLFYETVVKVNQKIGLPVILYLGDKYLHRDHVYPFFRGELTTQSSVLKQYYIEIMERMLRTRNKDKITVFYTRNSFKDDVMDRIKDNSPILAEFLDKPKIISEGIVHYFKNLKKVRDVNKIKDFMNNFFDDGMIRFKDPDYLLNLYLLEIFHEAYKYLSWWKKFMLKISGKYESFNSQFSGIAQDDNEIVLDPSTGSSRSVRKPSPGDTSQSSGRKYDETRVYRYRRNSPPSRSAKYNLKQRNKAWDEFQDAFNKKNH